MKNPPLRPNTVSRDTSRMASRSELRQTFRPVIIQGDPQALRAAAHSQGHLRLVGTEYATPVPSSNLRAWHLVLLALGAVTAGALIGLWWRKRRESAAQRKPKRALLGLDVMFSS